MIKHKNFEFKTAIKGSKAFRGLFISSLRETNGEIAKFHINTIAQSNIIILGLFNHFWYSTNAMLQDFAKKNFTLHNLASDSKQLHKTQMQ